jgi:phosphate:Na+ symporter
MEYSFKLKEEELSFSENAVGELEQILLTVNKLFEISMQAFDKRDTALIDSIKNVEEAVDAQTENLQDKHIERVKAGACAAQIGSVYLQTVSNLERIADHIYNVGVSISQYRKVAETKPKNA